jgi:hypothetical protein
LWSGESYAPLTGRRSVWACVSWFIDALRREEERGALQFGRYMGMRAIRYDPAKYPQLVDEIRARSQLRSKKLPASLFRVSTKTIHRWELKPPAGLTAQETLHYLGNRAMDRAHDEALRINRERD